MPKYPKPWKNDWLDKIKDLEKSIPPPWVEYPIMLGDLRYNPDTQSPGPVRAIYNDTDRRNFVIVYHDPQKPGRRVEFYGNHWYQRAWNLFSKAVHRPQRTPADGSSSA